MGCNNSKAPADKSDAPQAGKSDAPAGSAVPSSAAPLAPLPKTWANQDPTIEFTDISLAPDLVQPMQNLLSMTYKKVTTRDRKGATMPEDLKVIMVNRIENRDIYQAYAQEKKKVKDKRPHPVTQLAKIRGGDVLTKGIESITGELDSRVNEVMLWHGTSPGGAQGIAKTGFRLDFSGSATGSMFGHGVYLAECSSKSDEYAKDDSDGIYKGLYCLLLCRVTLGEMLTMTAGGDAVHGVVKAAMDSGAYESILGDREASVGTYREFVVCNEKQVYPEFVVLYQRILPGQVPEPPVAASSGSSTAAVAAPAGGGAGDPGADWINEKRTKIMEAQLVSKGFSKEQAAAIAAASPPPEAGAPPASDIDAKRAKIMESQLVSKGFSKEQAHLAVSIGPDAVAALMQAGPPQDASRV
eukprot:gnl/MRDRNA2_/MRDRNA2_48201_c0_seq1.p1 gnl/MRDRNA2_/MRDRNA2_48201_c0~~gnl/MRDRNA2_/MRDRNA2_48201_c0_seq1.p1  ORF type:complete len:412 (-),score=105.41 gnl/MRDRNA2_/MRDRNA2_48201_c0_seq1:211-1446(-)